MNDPHSDENFPPEQLARAFDLTDWDRASDDELERLLSVQSAEQLSPERVTAILDRTYELIFNQEQDPMKSPSQANVSQKTWSAPPKPSVRRRNGSGTVVILTGLVLAGVTLLMFLPARKDGSQVTAKNPTKTELPPGLREAFLPLAATESRLPKRVEVGERVVTNAREKQQILLPDGSVVYLNENTDALVKADRRLVVTSGEVFVEVVPHHLVEGKTPFVVETPKRDIMALGTKFLVNASATETDVLVTQGKVKVSRVEQPLTAGQQLKHAERKPAPRASAALLWTRELMANAESPLVPKSEHAGGALVAIDPAGQEMQLSLRKQKIDVHIEDGFARTTIDQTYFNASWSRMEGTFYFPLPADASLSRLAMYVGENLMEGGMAERNHARNVFEEIRHTRRDPALLEWVDGSTFKMRVFPLEGRQEKRIIISYTQRLEAAYGSVNYRFPAGHSLELIRDWSARVLVHGHGNRKWSSPSHEFESRVDAGDLTLNVSQDKMVDDRDLVLELQDAHHQKDSAELVRLSETTHEGWRYLMLRYRPDLKGQLKRKPRNWVFLFETAGNRDALLARTQIQILETLLKNAEHKDTFSIITAGTRAKNLLPKPKACTPQEIKAAVQALNEVHLVGALDLEKGLKACQPLLTPETTDREQFLIHLGAGVPVLGEKEFQPLRKLIPEGTKYVGVGVGKRWSREFMSEAADQTGGHITQINPDEQITWRSLELLSLLNAPRLLEATVTSDVKDQSYLHFAQSIAQGEELCAITRWKEDQPQPKSLTVRGQLDGKAFEKTFPVKDIAPDADYLPRTWAKLEIDRLIAAGAEQHKAEIISLSKAMYVMSPFTSLLVLETEAMYEQYKVDRGRKDHWALYPCPPKIPVVYEPNGPQPQNRIVSSQSRAQSVEELLKSLLVRVNPVTYHWSNGVTTVLQGLNGGQYYAGAIAQPLVYPQTRNQWNNWRTSGTTLDGFATTQFLEENESMLFGDFNGQVMLDDSIRLPIIEGRSEFRWGAPANSAERWFFNGTLTSRLRFDARRDATTWEFSREYIDCDFDGLESFDGYLGPFYPYSGRFNGRVGQKSRLLAPVPVITTWTERGQAMYGWGRPGISSTSTLAYPTMPLYPNGAVVDYPQMVTRFAGDIVFEAAPAINGPGPGLGMLNINGIADFTSSYGASAWPYVTPHYIAGGGGFGTNYWRQAPAIVTATDSHGLTPGWFGDLVMHAPGLNTQTIDVLSLLESQGPSELAPKRGKIDDRARKILNRAHEQGWEQVTLPAGENQTALTVHCDGQGRFAFERTVSIGLKERITHDGASLWHTYEELGLAGERNSNRHYRGILSRLVPWFVPSAEDLTVGVNVVSLDEQTLALVPLPSESADAKTEKLYVRLRFNEQGQLLERSLVDANTEKPRWTIQYASKGTVTISDSEGKTVRTWDWKRTPAKTPELAVNSKEVVVLSLPYRSPSSYLNQGQITQANNNQFVAFDDDIAHRIIGSYLALGNRQMLNNLLQQRYFARNDPRMGYAVLLAATYQQHGIGNPLGDLEKRYMKSDLAKYLTAHFEWARTGNDPKATPLEDDAGPFVTQLMRARNIAMRWKSVKADGQNGSDLAKLRDESLREIAAIPSPGLGWRLLTMVQAADPNLETLPDYLEAAKRFREEPATSLSARYQTALWQTENRDTEPAVAELKQLSKELLKAGMIPPITKPIRKSFVHHAGFSAWEKYLIDMQDRFLKEDHRQVALAIAVASERVEKDQLSERLVKRALENLEPTKHPATALLAAKYFHGLKQYHQVERYLAPLLKWEHGKKNPQLWRMAAEVARLTNQEALSIARLERALLLEYEHLPELVNIAKIREDYGQVLNRMQALANAENANDSLKQRAILLADRWRVLDPNDTPPCQVAGRIAFALDDKALAWDYFTTPLADKPNESAPWVALATEMVSQKNIDWADRAYRAAFEAEGTNAQILWDHAELMRQQGHDETSQELFEKLAQGNWQPRFASLKTQAQQRLKTPAEKPDPKDE